MLRNTEAFTSKYNHNTLLASEYFPPLNASVFPSQSILTGTLVATAIIPRLSLLVVLSVVFTVV